MTGKIDRTRYGWRIIAAAAIALSAAPADAGVVDGVRTVGDLTIYLGAVPAAITRGHDAAHTEARMHGGGAAQGPHAVHLVVALFDRRTGARITDASVLARVGEERGRQATVRLEPMTVDGALTFGGYTDIRTVADYRIEVEVTRPGRPQPSHPGQPPNPLIARFTYVHD